MHKFCFDENTTYNQYVNAAAANLPIQQLVPHTEFPSTLAINFIQFDNFSLGRFHEHCVSAVNVQVSERRKALHNADLRPNQNLLI
jgi:hypothetical protein